MNSPDHYERALDLMKYEIERLWIIFGTFMLAETVLLGGVGSVFKDGPNSLVIGGSALGVLLIVPWWGSFEYCRKFYLLRLVQARRLEAESGLLKEGLTLSRGDVVDDLRINAVIRFWRPQHGAWFLMILFGFAFISLAAMKL